MKTKIAQLLFVTSLFFNLNASGDIGGTTIPPKGSGPALKTATQAPTVLFTSQVINPSVR